MLDYRLFLCDSTKNEICEIQYRSLSFTRSFRDYNSLDFSVPYFEEGWELTEDQRFDLVKGLKFVHLYVYNGDTLVHEEYMVITDPNITSDESQTEKTVTCYSMEYLPFNKRRIRTYTEEKLLWDASKPTDKTAGLLNYIVNEVLYGTWTIGYISAPFLAIMRNWDYSSVTLTETFKDIEKQCNCFIFFDNVNQTISIYAAEEIGAETGLVISDSNMLKSISQDEKVTELTTRLRCYGANNIEISEYNITGLPYIDNFSWLVTNSLVSSGLATAITTYEALKASRQATFDGYIVQWEGYVEQLLLAQAQLKALEHDLEIIEDDLDAYKTQYPNNTAAYDARYADKIAKDATIVTKKAEIATIEADITAVKNNKANIVTELAYSTNFTAGQLSELNNFIFEEEVTVSTIATTQLLYEYAESLITKKAIPVIEVNVPLVDQIATDELINATGKFAWLDCADVGFDHVKVRVVQVKHNAKTGALSAILSNSDRIQKDIDWLATEVWQKSMQTKSKIDAKQYDWIQYVTEKSEILFSGDELEGTAGGITINRRGFLGTDITGSGAMQYLKDKVIISKDGFESYHTLLSGNGLYLEREDRAARIVIVPEYGFQMDKNVGTALDPIWSNCLYFDANEGEYYFDGKLTAEMISALEAEFDITVSNTMITNMLYSIMGTIANLTVDKLLTGDVLKDEAEMEFIDVHDSSMLFVYGQKDGYAEKVQYVNSNGEFLYYKDDTLTLMGTEQTLYPVMVSQYNNQNKMKIWFNPDDENHSPEIQMGIGDGITPLSGKGFIKKGPEGLELKYYAQGTGDVRYIKLNDDGIDMNPALIQYAETATTVQKIIGSTYESIGTMGAVTTASTRMTVNVHLIGAPSADLDAMLLVKLNGTDVLWTTKVYHSGKSDQMLVTGILPVIVAGTASVELFLRTSNDTLTVEAGAFRAYMEIRGGVVQEVPAYPFIKVSDDISLLSLSDGGMVINKQTGWLRLMDDILDLIIMDDEVSITLT